jgi:hypothetical protein
MAKIIIFIFFIDFLVLAFSSPDYGWFKPSQPKISNFIESNYGAQLRALDFKVFNLAAFKSVVIVENNKIELKADINYSEIVYDDAIISISKEIEKKINEKILDDKRTKSWQ